MKTNEKEYYEKEKNWDFSNFNFISEKLTNWDMYEILNNVTNKNSKILDLGTGGGKNYLHIFQKQKKY